MGLFVGNADYCKSRLNIFFVIQTVVGNINGTKIRMLVKYLKVIMKIFISVNNAN